MQSAGEYVQGSVMSGEKILLVEDDPKRLRLLQDGVLPSHGYRVATAATGREGLEKLASEEPDLVLIDLQLPDGAATELVKATRQHRPGIPVVLLTPQGSELLAARLVCLGARDFIVEPWNDKELRDTLDRSLIETRLRKEKERLAETLERRIEQSTILAEVGKSVVSLMDLEQLLNRIVEAGVYVANAEEGFLLLVDPQTNELCLRAEKNLGQEQAQGLRLKVEDSLAGEAVKTRKPVRRGSKDTGQMYKVKTGYLVRSLLHVPLTLRGQVIGVLSVDNQVAEREFTEEDEYLLSALADYAAISIENARLYGETDQALSMQARELSILLETSEAVSSALSLDELLQALCQKMIESVQASFCKIYLLDNEGSSLTLRATKMMRGSDWDPDGGRTFRLDSLPWHRRAITEGKPLILQRSTPPADLPELERSLALGAGAKSALLLPLMVKGRALGVVTLGEVRSWDRSPFTSTKIQLCQALARQGALATEGMLMFESMAHQSQRIQLIIDSVADGVFSTDLGCRILAFNPAAEKITGYLAKDVMGKRCSDVLGLMKDSAQERCSNDCALTLSGQGGQDAAHVTHKKWITRGDGTQIFIVHSVSPLIDENGELKGAVSVIRDVSREEELNRLKSEFIALVSHQLRTPLASISASAELLGASQLDQRARIDVIDTLGRQCLRLTRLVDQVLEASRLEAGRLTTIAEPLALRALIEETVHIFRSRYPAYLFSVHVPKNLQFALGDRACTEVVVDNLLQNAVNYSPEGSSIDICAEEREDSIVLSVVDQGVGIPPDQLDKIFGRFHTPTRHGPEEVHGFGLGLYIAKALVQAQGGEIWVESQRGEGSRFHFSLKKFGGLNEAEGEDTAH
jgi:PAS domain S-box-containing protein